MRLRVARQATISSGSRQGREQGEREKGRESPWRCGAREVSEAADRGGVRVASHRHASGKVLVGKRYAGVGGCQG